MPDISMCTDSKCPARVACYRYRAKPVEYQTYTDFVRVGINPCCDSFLPIWEGSTIRPIEEIEPSMSKTTQTVDQSRNATDFVALCKRDCIQR
jgi:hypothetical protein